MKYMMTLAVFALLNNLHKTEAIQLKATQEDVDMERGFAEEEDSVFNSLAQDEDVEDFFAQTETSEPDHYDKQAVSIVDRFDTNSDNKISVAEFKAKFKGNWNEKYMNDFNIVDADKDGEITEAEIAKYYRDKNKAYAERRAKYEKQQREENKKKDERKPPPPEKKRNPAEDAKEMGDFMNFRNFTPKEFMAKYDRNKSGTLDTKEILYNALSKNCTNESGCMERAHKFLMHYNDNRDQRLTLRDLEDMFKVYHIQSGIPPKKEAPPKKKDERDVAEIVGSALGFGELSLAKAFIAKNDAHEKNGLLDSKEIMYNGLSDECKKDKECNQKAWDWVLSFDKDGDHRFTEDDIEAMINAFKKASAGKNQAV